ncbi:MAG: 16S rRNA (guanine(966)-N(2))-methyltransferase RsmD [Chloroflexota bacterium]
MRVISGRAKGRKLKLVPGQTTRPVMDRVKENLFNILGDTVAGTRWLDLFAGTGQVGIEALSRGAAECVFIDTARPAIRTIHENLAHTQLSQFAQVLGMDAFDYVRTGPGRPFDLVYVAPPQYQGLWLKALQLIDQKAEACLTAGGQVIAQIHPKEFQELSLVHLRLVDQRRYGATMLCFYEVKRET